jgi:hypothetical protein
MRTGPFISTVRARVRKRPATGSAAGYSPMLRDCLLATLLPVRWTRAAPITSIARCWDADAIVTARETAATYADLRWPCRRQLRRVHPPTAIDLAGTSGSPRVLPAGLPQRRFREILFRGDLAGDCEGAPGGKNWPALAQLMPHTHDFLFFCNGSKWAVQPTRLQLAPLSWALSQFHFVTRPYLCRPQALLILLAISIVSPCN